MDINDFLHVVTFIKRQDIRIDKLDYDYHVFGSWVVAFTREGKNFRLVWDGKDRWMIMESRIAQEYYTGTWCEQWTIRDTVGIEFPELGAKILATIYPKTQSK